MELSFEHHCPDCGYEFDSDEAVPFVDEDGEIMHCCPCCGCEFAEE